MKTLILLFTMVTAAVYLYSQKLTVYEIKTDNYPRVTAKMLAVDSNYLNIPGIVNSDIEFYEDGAQKDLLYISCPITTKPLQISSVLTIDISSSMSLSNLNIAIKAAEEWINMLDMNNAECALTTFNSKAYLNIDFTREKSNLKYMLYNMLPINGT
ncbi:MAG: hypothetical protein QG635_836, partial [Bacteroidota bacterium]|nr:hypothetical protein [Bacteroidota bacterium]